MQCFRIETGIIFYKPTKPTVCFVHSPIRVLGLFQSLNLGKFGMNYVLLLSKTKFIKIKPMIT
jgi:hypothetical protein